MIRAALIKLAALLCAVVTAVLLLPAGSAFAESAANAEIGEYIQITYGDTDGMLTNEANTVLHTRNGYIWIGSYSGLTRYDSYKFTTYGNTSGSVMEGVSVRALFEDKRGRLWIGSNDNGVYLWEDGEFSKIDIEAGKISNCIRAFAETADGDIIVASTAGAAVISRSDSGFTVRPSTLPELTGSPVYDVICDSSGNCWAATNLDVISFTISGMHENKRFSLAENYPMLCSREFNCITQASNDKIYIGTSGNELIRLSRTLSLSGYVADIISTGDTSNACYSINCIMQDSNGRIWLCSDTGIGYLDGGSVTYAGTTEYSTSIEKMTEDYEGNLWFASSREGVMELVRGKFRSTNPHTGLDGVTVNATIVYDGKLFAATDSGVSVFELPGLYPVTHPLSKLLSGIRVRGLMADSQGYLWVTTYMQYGVIRYKDGEYISIAPSDGLTSEKSRVAVELADGSVAVTTNGGISIISNGAVVKTYTEADGLSNPVILSLCQDNDGRLYCGSDGNGIYVIEPDGSVTNITSEDGLSSDVILSLIYDSAHQCIWIGSGAELSVLTANGIRKAEQYRNSTGSIFDIKLLENEMWVLSSSGIVTLPYDSALNGLEECTVYSRSDGISDITSNSRHYLSPDGILYIATSNGVYTIDANSIYSNSVPPKAIINSITIDNEAVINNPEGTIEIDSDTSMITIEFTALNYLPGECTVEYQLIGMDSEPIIGSGSETHKRDYTNLKGGNYVFRVAVVSPYGVRSEEDVTLRIYKKASFIEHPLVISAICAAGAAVIYFFARVYLKIKTARLRASQERYRNITETALRTIAKTIDAKDSYTNGHSYRVAQYSRKIAERLGWTDEELEKIYYAALLHDIGKIGVPDSILTKPGKLTDEEYSIIKQHPAIGYEILKDITDIPEVCIGARYHHERYDGNGYVEGLKGEDIPMVSRIIAVADAYDSMSTARVYRDALSVESIFGQISDGMGKQFDPQAAQIMLDLIREGIHYD